jgi:hypothetical protein
MYPLLAALLALTAALHADTTGTNTPPTEDEGDEGTGEVDEDILIQDEEDTNDDEGVNN